MPYYKQALLTFHSASCGQERSRIEGAKDPRRRATTHEDADGTNRAQGGQQGDPPTELTRRQELQGEAPKEERAEGSPRPVVRWEPTATVAP